MDYVALLGKIRIFVFLAKQPSRQNWDASAVSPKYLRKLLDFPQQYVLEAKKFIHDSKPEILFHSIQIKNSWKIYRKREKVLKRKKYIPQVNKKDRTNEKERGLDYDNSVLFSCSNFWEKQLSASQHTYVENRKCPGRLQ